MTWPTTPFAASYFSHGSHGFAAEPGGALPKIQAYNLHAGAHEREVLRGLHFTVEMNGFDMQPGNGLVGRKHTDEACQLLWNGQAGNYLQLWQKRFSCSEVLRRARDNLHAGLITLHDIQTTVIPHLTKAVYCRRLDIWSCDAGNRAVEKYRTSTAYDSDLMVSKGRADNICGIIKNQARIASSKGLTIAAAAKIAEDAGQAARVSYASRPEDGLAARTQARKCAEVAIETAQEMGLTDVTMADGALLTSCVWNAFCVEAHLEAGHREMHDAMFSVLKELEAEFGYEPNAEEINSMKPTCGESSSLESRR